MNIDKRELKEILQSSNINFLFGAGCSSPYLALLANIEKSISEANGNNSEITKQLKKYFEGVILPSLSILDNGANLSTKKPSKKELSEKEKYDLTVLGYSEFFSSINKILLYRKSTLLNKQANIFTTNIDIFLEKVLENMNLEYNDGFSGNFDPTFRTSNFNKSIQKVSTHFSNVSEIPTFNLIKLHGSLSWKSDKTKENIVFSKLGEVQTIDRVKSDDAKFRKEYDKLQIINPTKNKLQETVIDVTYYELLRLYSSELEKENTVLFVIGFSMEDEHIRAITKRVADSNPTLKIYILCHSNGSTKNLCDKWFGEMRYQNVAVIAPDEEEKHYDLATITSDLFENILDVKKIKNAEIKPDKEIKE